MKKAAIVLTILLLTFTLVPLIWATPFLVCDPQDAWNPSNGTGVDHYEYSTDNGKTWQALDSEVVGTDQIRIHQDLSALTPGKHSWKVRAVNPWEASAVVPFDFTSGAPDAPAAITLEW